MSCTHARELPHTRARTRVYVCMYFYFDTPSKEGAGSRVRTAASRAKPSQDRYLAGVQRECYRHARVW
eukprot:6172397-Pleurochrysis_carterae.AAC.1